jgi:hypothetical protein
VVLFFDTNPSTQISQELLFTVKKKIKNEIFSFSSHEVNRHLPDLRQAVGLQRPGILLKVFI